MQPIDPKRSSLSASAVPSKRPLSFADASPRRSPRKQRDPSEEIDELDDTSSQEFPTDENRNPHQSTSKLSPQPSPARTNRSTDSVAKRPRMSTDSGFAELSGAAKVEPVCAVSDSEDEGAGLLGLALEEEVQRGMDVDQDRGTETQMEQESMAVSHGSPQRPVQHMSPVGLVAAMPSVGELRLFNDNGENIEDWSLEKLRTERQLYTDRRCNIMEGLMEIMENGGGKSSDGHDTGYLRHNKAYIDERVAELVAEIPRREAELAAASGGSATGAPRQGMSGNVVRSIDGKGTSSHTAGSSQTSVSLAAQRRRDAKQVAQPVVKSAHFPPKNLAKSVASPLVRAAPPTPRPAVIETTAPLRFNHPSHQVSDEAPPQQSTSKFVSRRPQAPAPAPPPPRSPPRAFRPAPISAPKSFGSGAKGKGRAEVDSLDELLKGVDFDDSYRNGIDSQAVHRTGIVPMSEDEEEEEEDEIIIPARAERRVAPPVAPIRRIPPPTALSAPKVIPKPVAPFVRQPVAPPKLIPPKPLAQNSVAHKSDAIIKSGGKDPAHDSSAPKITHPWSRDVSKALRQRFGLAGFRQNQEDAINATLAGDDVFVLLPTGGGKSLCFQLPAVVQSGKTKGVTIVVSPLLSLISDQCKSLIEKDIPVIYINSTLSAPDRSFAMSMLTSEPPTTCLAYVTPELIVNSGQFQGVLQSLHRRKQLARFVIDEAHCVSSWGHDFRPDYKQMNRLKRDYPGIPLIALTATANDRVKRDILDNLGMRDCLTLTQSFNRPNLKYEVRPKTKKVVEDIATFIRDHHAGECGIIYCNSKAKCEDMADKLRREYKIEARHYHAGMNKDDRASIQTGWQVGDFQVICATIAFGMGIDKPDVRYVIHHSLSGSLEAYYQETGRAGRDGKTSICVLYFTYGDTRAVLHLIDASEVTREQKDYNRDNLKRVVQYCLNLTDCRRSQVLSYFGEKFPREKCHKTCDNCLRGEVFEYKDVTDIATKATKVAQALEREKGLTVALCVSILRGSKMKKVMEKGYNELEWYGAGAKYDLGDVERLFQLLLNEDVLGERFETVGAGHTHTYVITGKRKQDLLSGKMNLEMAFSEKKANSKAKVARDELVGEAYLEAEEGYEEDEEEIYEVEVEGADDFAGDDVHSRCYCELMALRKQSATKERCVGSTLVRDEVIQTAALTLPIDSKEWSAIEGADDVSTKWYFMSGADAILLRFAEEAGKAVPVKAAAPTRPPVKRAAPVASTSKAKALAPKKIATVKVGLPKAPPKAPAKARAAPAKTGAKSIETIRSFAFAGGSGAASGGGIKAMPIRKK